MPLRISESGIKPTSANKPAGEKSHSRRAVSAGLRDDFNLELSMKNPIRAVPTGRVLRLAIVATISATGWASTLSAEEATPLTEQQKIVHVLNRLGFGPRPGDVERLRAIGLPAYVDEQLHPNDADDALWAEWAAGGSFRPHAAPTGLGALDEPFRFDLGPGGDRPA